jgi:hypothetical protein
MVQARGRAIMSMSILRLQIQLMRLPRVLLPQSQLFQMNDKDPALTSIWHMEHPETSQMSRVQIQLQFNQKEIQEWIWCTRRSVSGSTRTNEVTQKRMRRLRVLPTRTVNGNLTIRRLLREACIAMNSVSQMEDLDLVCLLNSPFHSRNILLFESHGRRTASLVWNYITKLSSRLDFPFSIWESTPLQKFPVFAKARNILSKFCIVTVR